MRGHPHALPGGIVVPSVVRANQAAILNTTAGKSSAAMETKIFPRAKASSLRQRTRSCREAAPAGLLPLPCPKIGYNVPIVE